MKPKLISLLLFSAAVMLGGIYYWQFLKKDSADFLSSISLAPGQAMIAIDFGFKGQERFFKGEVVEDMSLLDALRVSAMAGNLELEINGDVGAEKIVKIDGLSQGKDGGSWHYYLGNQKLNNSPSEIFIKPGDRFKFVYEK